MVLFQYECSSVNEALRLRLVCFEAFPVFLANRNCLMLIKVHIMTEHFPLFLHIQQSEVKVMAKTSQFPFLPLQSHWEVSDVL